MKRTLVLVFSAVLALFAVTGLFAQFKVGDTGLGQGIVFYSQGGTYLECLGRIFGPTDWYTAEREARHYMYNGKGDWRLPTKAELSEIYKTIKKNGLMDFKDYGYWTSEDSTNVENTKWYVNFKNGYGGSKHPLEKYYYCLVRSY